MVFIFPWLHEACERAKKVAVQEVVVSQPSRNDDECLCFSATLLAGNRETGLLGRKNLWSWKFISKCQRPKKRTDGLDMEGAVVSWASRSLRALVRR